MNKAVQSRRFKLQPKRFPTCNVEVTPIDSTMENQPMKYSMTQILVNASDATTGHKFEGLTKDNLNVYSCTESTHWIYVVLSYIRTLSGPYSCRSLKLWDIKPPPQDYLAFLGWMKKLQEHDLERSRRNQCGE